MEETPNPAVHCYPSTKEEPEFSDTPILPFTECQRKSDEDNSNKPVERKEFEVPNNNRASSREHITCSPDFMELAILEDLNNLQANANKTQNISNKSENEQNEMQNRNEIKATPKMPDTKISDVSDLKNFRKKFECEECHKNFSSKIKLQVHLENHSHENFFQCNVCQMRFSHRTGFTRHIRSHDENNPHRNTEQQLNPLQTGYGLIQNGYNPAHSVFDSIPSGYNIVNRDNLVHCSNVSSQGNTFNYRDDNSVSDTDLSSLHRTDLTFQRGNSAHRENNLNTRNSSLIDSLNNPPPNIENRVYDDDWLQCDICKRVFWSKTDYNIHKRTHSAVKEKPFLCPICNKGFVSKSSLYTHKKSHLNETDIKCDKCGEVFRKKSQINQHLKIHSGKKTFQCSTCGNYFTTKLALNVHNRMHTGEKPYECNFCEKAFTCKFYLDTHRRVHTGEKPFKCDICQKHFSQKSTLNTHKKLHLKKMQMEAAQQQP